MPAIACIPPWAMKEILEHFGYRVIAEDDYNWVLSDTHSHLGVRATDAEEKEPLTLSKRGELLAVDVMMATLINAKLDLHTYFALKQTVLGGTDADTAGTKSKDTIN